jgi:hypothetical protein
MHIHVFWLYPILFMSCLCKYVCVNAFKSLVYVSFVNMPSLEKSEVSVFMVLLTKPDWSVFQIGLSGFDRLSIFLQILFVVILLSCASHNTCSHTQNYCTYWMHRYRGLA